MRRVVLGCVVMGGMASSALATRWDAAEWQSVDGAADGRASASDQRTVA